MQEDLPFGGFGASGMARITVLKGLETEPLARIYSQTMIDVLPIIGAWPPFGEKFRNRIRKALGPI